MKNATKTVSVVMAVLICVLCFAGCGANSPDSGNSLKNAQVGDYIVFGSYEQDNNTSNGKEDIEWLVLAKEGNNALVISRYALDGQLYNTSYDDVTWETCSLRKWLNETFISNAFTSNEQNMIQSTTVTADKNPSYNTSPGNNTTDKVFLLSITEANKYFGSDSARQCQGTAYCYAQGVDNDDNNSWWWLRSPGFEAVGAAVVEGGGFIDDYGAEVNEDDYAVRPAMWIEIGSKENLNTDGEATVTEDIEQNEAEKLKTAKVGDYIVFGSYEQDNNTSNGKEDIEWLVLAKDGDKELVVSKYALDEQPYDSFYDKVTWENCSVREWLNETFINDAFSIEEQDMIQSTTVSADYNPKYNSWPGNDTTDKIFLLSVKEVNMYFSTDEARKCAPTLFAMDQGAFTSDSEIVDGRGACIWMLRTPGSGNSLKANVDTDGSVKCLGSLIRQHGTIRPAMWIDLSA